MEPTVGSMMATASRQGSELEEGRERLRSILDGVAQAAEELEKRLQAVLTPSDSLQVDQTLKEIKPARGALAEEIHGRADQADQIQQQLHRLLGRLEL
jgi:predicted nuclease with TOPRIM domain